MKRIVSIFFLIIYLFSTTEVYQLGKLPVLFEHYVAHRAADKSITIIDFLDEHYVKDSPNDPDHAADMQLPFKKHNDHVAVNISSITFLSQPSQLIVPVVPASSPEKEYNLYNTPFFTSAHLINIWQPPKAA